MAFLRNLLLATLLASSAAWVEGHAARHPAAREVRMVVGVVRDGTRGNVLRLRAVGDGEDERVTGPDLAPALAEALLATLS